MPLRNGKPLTVRMRSLSDCVDSTNAFPGAMLILSNLIPAPHTADQWICRPAATDLTDFTGFNTPGQIELLFRAGHRVYGMIATARNSGHSEPFIYDLLTNAFITVAGISAGNTPVSQPTAGEWVPATADTLGARVMVTHPGFTLPNAFGWFDMTGYTSTGIAGQTHGSTTVNNFPQSVLALGWRPGMTIADSAGDIPANTRIVQIAANGLSLTLDTAATGTNATNFQVAGGTFAAPLWCAGNVNDLPLVAVATAVAQYAGSACYAVNTDTSAAIEFSDPADPLRVTNAAGFQVTTFENSLPVTALKGLTLRDVTGGVVQSLIAFQGVSAIQQITGTPATLSLGVNKLTDNVGTAAPNSVVQVPNVGMFFAAPDGLRLITQDGTVSDPIAQSGQGIATPFIYALYPSRICAAYNEDVYRVTVTAPQYPLGSPSATVTTREYWFHLGLKKWSGPHTFPASLILPTTSPNGFVMAASGINAKLWSSDALPNLNAVYTENGAPLVFQAMPSLLPDTGAMAENEIIEAAIGACITSEQPLSVAFFNEMGIALDSITITGVDIGSAVWDTAIWDVAIWGGGTAPYRQYQCEWHQPLIFHQGTISIAGLSQMGIVLGNVYLRYQILRYLLQGTPLYA